MSLPVCWDLRDRLANVRCHVENHCRAEFACTRCRKPLCRIHSEACCGARFCQSCFELHRTKSENNVGELQEAV